MARGLVSQQSLIDTANAIRFSTENSTKMLPSEMPDNIRSIEGKIIALPKGRVNFYDYDGELLHSYSPIEFIEKGLPENPRHEGLVAQGWNWDYEEITTQIKKVGGDINVGQMYITQSGATQIDIELDQEGLEPYLYFSGNSFFIQYIDWGDNSELIENISSSNIEQVFNQKHIYSQPGKYTIKIKITSGTIYFSTELLWDNISNTNNFYKNKVINIRIGENVCLDEDFDIKNYFSLQTFIIPKTLKYNSIDLYHAFENCYSLKIIIIPNLDYVGFMTYEFNQCYNIQYIILPYNILAYPMTKNCYNLKALTFPFSLNNIDPQKQNIFNNCYSLKRIFLPNSIISISNSTFQNCYNILEYHFQSTTPPTLGTNVFTGINQNCKIYVPYSTDHSVLNAYKTATNWSNWADYIFEEDAPIDYAMPTPLASRPNLFVDSNEVSDGDEFSYSIQINIIDEQEEV